MIFGRRDKQPVDRAVEDLERQLAQVRREIRTVARQEAMAPVAGLTGHASTFVREMLAPSAPATAPSYRAARRDLFDDGSGEALKELAAEPIEFVKKTDPDLFGKPQPAPAMADVPGTVSLDSPAQEKLVHYLSAGALRGQKRPLKHVQRKERNRFFTWMGLTVGAVWLIYVVVR